MSSTDRPTRPEPPHWKSDNLAFEQAKYIGKVDDYMDALEAENRELRELVDDAERLIDQGSEVAESFKEQNDAYKQAEVDMAGRITELEAGRNIAETRRGEMQRILEEHHSPDVRYFAEQAKRITELESQLGEAVRYSVEEIRRRTATMAERDEYKESLAKAHRLWTKDTHRITALEGAIRDGKAIIGQLLDICEDRLSFMEFRDFEDRIAALAGEQVGTELHSTSMQDGQMVNGEQPNQETIDALTEDSSQMNTYETVDEMMNDLEQTTPTADPTALIDQLPSTPPDDEENPFWVRCPECETLIELTDLMEKYDAEHTARVEAERERDELRAEGQQMHDDNLTLREQRRKSRELLEALTKRVVHISHQCHEYTATYDVLDDPIERHLSGEDHNVS